MPLAAPTPVELDDDLTSCDDTGDIAAQPRWIVGVALVVRDDVRKLHEERADDSVPLDHLISFRIRLCGPLPGPLRARSCAQNALYM